MKGEIDMLQGTTSRWTQPWIYFAATFAWTWSFWGLAIALGAGMDSGLGFVLLLLGVTGPMVTGIGFTYLTRDRDGRRDYWSRIVGVRRISAMWFLVILLFVPIVNLVAAGVDLLLGGTGATWGEALRNLASNPLSIIPSILFASLVPFIEELGWRGYVLDRLQERRTALTASLVLGVVWAAWHLPLFFVAGSYQAGLGVGTLEFWLFMVGVVPLTVAFSWIFNNTRRSTLAVILFHAMVNFTGELIALTERADTLSVLMWIVAAVAIVTLFGARTLAGRRRESSSPVVAQAA